MSLQAAINELDAICAAHDAGPGIEAEELCELLVQRGVRARALLKSFQGDALRDWFHSQLRPLLQDEAWITEYVLAVLKVALERNDNPFRATAIAVGSAVQAAMGISGEELTEFKRSRN